MQNPTRLQRACSLAFRGATKRRLLDHVSCSQVLQSTYVGKPAERSNLSTVTWRGGRRPRPRAGCRRVFYLNQNTLRLLVPNVATCKLFCPVPVRFVTVVDEIVTVDVPFLITTPKAPSVPSP